VTLTAALTSAPAQSVVADRYAAADRFAARVPNAAADRSSAPVPSVAVDHFAEPPREAADRCVVVVRTEESLRGAPDRCVAPVQIVVTLDGVRFAAQKEGDWSVQADLPVEVDRSVVIPNGVLCAAQSVVTPSGVQCVAQSAVIPNGVLCVAQSEVTLNEVGFVVRSAVIRIGVQFVARIGFHSLSHRPHALEHSRLQGCSRREGCYRFEAATVAPCVPDVHRRAQAW
jgi:hypothetical protein